MQIWRAFCFSLGRSPRVSLRPKHFLVLVFSHYKHQYVYAIDEDNRIIRFQRSQLREDSPAFVRCLSCYCVRLDILEYPAGLFLCRPYKACSGRAFLFIPLIVWNCQVLWMGTLVAFVRNPERLRPYMAETRTWTNPIAFVS